MNVDGSWNREKKLARFGIILKGDARIFVAARCGSFEDISFPLQVEAMAVREGLVWVVNRGFQNTNVRAICFKLWMCQEITIDIKALLSTITEVTITHTLRQANGVAHRLARLGLSLSQVCDWYDSPPNLVVDLLVEEILLP
ncbi:hypothetical protein D8674_000531 [Pyrus ussuriensis x Pyrus communis]|uniref:RNase H type-1 domain-containing protein n=1 Tax=Pyrus ussuriensis x Pyrus communis TaxID=2448454 RepID=A0A5N5F6A1_9ROSA|nr:hypothetical protein D8674_000531 [Pyrus ussuriensis x Pyrus communis]